VILAFVVCVCLAAFAFVFFGLIRRQDRSSGAQRLNICNPDWDNGRLIFSRVRSGEASPSVEYDAPLFNSTYGFDVGGPLHHASGLFDGGHDSSACDAGGQDSGADCDAGGGDAGGGGGDGGGF
jgi:hypothetical protein